MNCSDNAEGVCKYGIVSLSEQVRLDNVWYLQILQGYWYFPRCLEPVPTEKDGKAQASLSLNGVVAAGSVFSVTSVNTDGIRIVYQ